MIKRKIDTDGKGWYTGPWDSAVPVALGYADAGFNETHVHAQMYEAYFVARGQSVALVDGQQVALRVGDLLVVEPGERHTFLTSSEDYLHFVVQAPFVSGDKEVAS